MSRSSNDPLVPLTISELQANLDRSPFIAFLGLKVVEADPARGQVTMTSPAARIRARSRHGQCMAGRWPPLSTPSATMRW